MPVPHESPSAHASGRRLTRVAASIVSLAVVACDIPTDLPIVDTRWSVPVEETRFGVADLLPGSVSLTPDGSAFLVDFDPVTFSETLGSLCPACIPADGLTVPKPPFLNAFASSVDFPAEVSSISLVSGDVLIEIDNGLAFDPLRPTAGVFGRLTIKVTDDADGDLLGTLTIDGAVTPLPAGGTLTRTMPLAATTVEGSLVATVTIDSPAGDPVTIDVAELLQATATPMNVVVAGVTIDVAGRVVSLDPVTLDIWDDTEDGWFNDLKDDVLGGALVVDVENPFGVTAAIQLALTGPTTIQKSATVGPAPTSTVEIPFTANELRDLLFEGAVSLTGSATVDAAAAPTTVTAGQELVLTSRMDLSLRLGAGS